MNTQPTQPITPMQQRILAKFPELDGIELPRIAEAMRADGFSMSVQRVHHYVLVLWKRGHVERESGRWSGKWRRKNIKNQPVDSSMTRETTMLPSTKVCA